MKKLGKELRGKVDSTAVETRVREIMRDNFPSIDIPGVKIRDNKTISVELNKKTSGGIPEIIPDDYSAKLKAALAKSEYSVWIQVNDYREKPYVTVGGVADIMNAAVKKVGGRWVKMLSGVKPGDVFMLRSTSRMDKEETAQDKARRKIPNPSEIKAIIK